MLESDLKFESLNLRGEKEIYHDENEAWYIRHYNGQYAPEMPEYRALMMNSMKIY